MSHPLARVIVGADDAPTLMLLHGITASAVSQTDAIDHWAALGYRVVAVDARGHGLSPRWTPQELERAGEVLVDDAVAVLEDLLVQARGRRALDLVAAPPPVVVGHSMGAATAMVVGGRRPELVSGVVLLDPARYGSRGPAELLARGAARERARAAELADPAAAVARTTRPVEPIPREVPALLVTGDRPGAARVGPEGLEVVRRIANPGVTTALVPGAAHDVRRTRPGGFYDVVDPGLAGVLRPRESERGPADGA